jgi:hypothetical protein
MFRGRDNIGIRALLRESMHAHYEALIDDNGNKDYTILNDFYTAISDTIDYAGGAALAGAHLPDRVLHNHQDRRHNQPIRHHGMARD